MIIAVDWSYIKKLTTYDGVTVKVESQQQFLRRMMERKLEPSVVIVEQGCPLSLVYSLLRAGSSVRYISNGATCHYRETHGEKKTDENDARAIWELSQSGAKLTESSLSDTELRVHSLYGSYHRYQKARLAMLSMKKAHERHYGGGESDMKVSKSVLALQPPPYDAGIKSLKVAEEQCLRELETVVPKPPPMRGLGIRIWAGVSAVADPRRFRNLSSYLRFCGLTQQAVASKHYSRRARSLYHNLATCMLKCDNQEFRHIYDKCKADISDRHLGYTKAHVHDAALNRTATFLAKHIFHYMKSKELEL